MTAHLLTCIDYVVKQILILLHCSLAILFPFVCSDWCVMWVVDTQTPHTAQMGVLRTYNSRSQSYSSDWIANGISSMYVCIYVSVTFCISIFILQPILKFSISSRDFSELNWNWGGKRQKKRKGKSVYKFQWHIKKKE